MEELQWNWDTYGKEDPMWAIAVDASKRNNKWNHDEFFAMGVQRMDAVVAKAREYGYPGEWKTALDFGCGVGRLTQAMCAHFDTCVGVDIAPSMVEKAKTYNKYKTKCCYLVNDRPDLGKFAANSFDFVYTEHVLQHIWPQVSARYILEFIRVLKPGGLLAFHIPCALARFVYPETGLSAAIESATKLLHMGANQKTTVAMTVTNTGEYAWGKHGDLNLPVQLTVHWLTTEGTIIHACHEKQTIPGVVAPGESVDMNFPVHALAEPGEYLLAFDLVDFNGRPFSTCGSEPLPMAAVVEPEAERPAESEADSAPGKETDQTQSKRPHMDMYSIPVEDVKKLIAVARGTLLDVHCHDTGIDANTPCFYYVTK